MSPLLSGAIVMACAVIGLHFLRFWKSTRDRFFLYFALSFFIQGGQWLHAAVVGASGDWMRQPTLWPALLTGVLTMAVPFFIMQPGMGLGIAASKTPNPNVARLRSLVTHSVFGVGLYASAWVVARLLAAL